MQKGLQPAALLQVHWHLLGYRVFALSGQFSGQAQVVPAVVVDECRYCLKLLERFFVFHQVGRGGESIKGIGQCGSAVGVVDTLGKHWFEIELLRTVLVDPHGKMSSGVDGGLGRFSFSGGALLGPHKTFGDERQLYQGIANAYNGAIVGGNGGGSNVGKAFSVEARR